MKPKFLIVLGTRPEIIKLAPIVYVLTQRKIHFEIVHTGQHYSTNMDQIFWDDFKLPTPKYNLAIQEKTHALQVSKMVEKLDEIIQLENPNWVLVQGDTNSTFAGALAAAKRPGVRIAHIEAGLRSFDRTMPEEVNRVITDHLSDFLFAPTQVSKKYLLKEGLPSRKIAVVGNTVQDILLRRMKGLKPDHALQKAPYCLLTLHRQENTGDTKRLTRILEAVFEASKQHGLKLIFPIHPRTKSVLSELKFQIPPHVTLIDPVGYDQFLNLQKNARIVATDSGGLQEESCILNVPCITLRENT
ncbi:MAG: non-hydrolyzing UDP-N-acetylglucosamine 2-epimerase, partial [Pseudobdellovibrionaceae bacterium]